MMNKIVDNLPYGDSFKFIKKIISIDQVNIITEVLFSSNSFYYNSHFINNPVVPGVIITEAIGQSALMSHVYFIVGMDMLNTESKKCFLSNIQVEFIKSPEFDKPYYVKGEKKFFRNNLFRSNAVLMDEDEVIYAQFTGTLKLI